MLDTVSAINDTNNNELCRWNDYLASKMVGSATHESWRTVCRTPLLYFPPVSLPDDSLPHTRVQREDLRHPCVRRLLEPSNSTAYNAETYVLTALALALRHYSEEPWCRIETEDIGCGCWPDEPDVTGMVGRFTLFHPWAIPLHSGMAVPLSVIASDLTKYTHGEGGYGLLQIRHTSEDSLVQGVRMDYIGVQVQLSPHYFHIDHFNSDIYAASENALGCMLEFNIARSAVDGLSFHCRFDPTCVAPNDVQLLLTCYKNSLTDLGARLC